MSESPLRLPKQFVKRGKLPWREGLDFEVTRCARELGGGHEGIYYGPSEDCECKDATSFFLKALRPLKAFKYTNTPGERSNTKPCVTALEIPMGAAIHMSAAYGIDGMDSRKLRADKVAVLQHQCWQDGSAITGDALPLLGKFWLTVSTWDRGFQYPVGDLVEARAFSGRAIVCGPGIHFFCP